MARAAACRAEARSLRDAYAAARPAQARPEEGALRVAARHSDRFESTPAAEAHTSQPKTAEHHPATRPRRSRATAAAAEQPAGRIPPTAGRVAVGPQIRQRDDSRHGQPGQQEDGEPAGLDHPATPGQGNCQPDQQQGCTEAGPPGPRPQEPHGLLVLGAQTHRNQQGPQRPHENLGTGQRSGGPALARGGKPRTHVRIGIDSTGREEPPTDEQPHSREQGQGTAQRVVQPAGKRTGCVDYDHPQVDQRHRRRARLSQQSDKEPDPCEQAGPTVGTTHRPRWSALPRVLGPPGGQGGQRGK